MKSSYNDNALNKFIYKKCFYQISEAVSRYVSENPTRLKLKYSYIKYPTSASVMNMSLEFATNIIIDEDTLSFDAVVDCEMSLEEEIIYDTKRSETNLWFKVNCSAVIKDKVKNFKVNGVESYSKNKRLHTTGVTADANIVPLIYSENLDREATMFLERYCPEALETPMAVPIEGIVKEKMGLTIITGKRLTDNFSLFGQICFSSGKVNVYDVETSKTYEIDVERGTILIDASTFWERNIGCVNNTIAHEAFHWHRHRVYAAIRGIINNDKFIAHRCSVNSISDIWNDEDRMEWQASKIAPRILMPIETTNKKIKELYEKYNYYINDNEYEKNIILEIIIDKLADFYKVSKQSAKIRMLELGYNEVEYIYNFKDKEPNFKKISTRDAFYEYCDNKEFRKVIDSNLFIYTNGYFVISNEKYVTKLDDGSYSLTNYAQNNLNECTLQFTYRNVNMQEHGKVHTDIFHRQNTNQYEKLPHYNTDNNISVINNAEELSQKVYEFENQYKEHKILTKTFWQRAYEIMQHKKWNSSIFMEKTLLNETVFSRAKNNHNSLPSFRTVISICAGLDLDIKLTSELLASAGHCFSNSREHQAYGYIITGLKGKSIYERNKFLEEANVEPLGSKQFA